MLAIRKASLAAVTLALTLALCGVAEAVPMNLAPGGTSTADSQAWGSVFQDGNDGNRDGNFGNGSVWHTTDFIGTHYYEVDLGSDYYLDRVQLFPRTGAGPHWTNFRIEVRDSSNAVVFNQSFLPTASADVNWGTTAVRNVLGQTVRIETNGTPLNTSHAEFEVWGQSRPIRANLAPAGTVTGTPGGWGSTTADAIDGDIDGHFYHPGFPMYHSNASGVGMYWQVDLGSQKIIDYINLYARAEGPTRPLVDLLIYDAAMTLVFSTTIDLDGTDLNATRYNVTVALPPLTLGQIVRLETVQGEFLVFNEIEIFEGIPEPGTLSLLALGGLGLWRRRRKR